MNHAWNIPRREIIISVITIIVVNVLIYTAIQYYKNYANDIKSVMALDADNITLKNNLNDFNEVKLKFYKDLDVIAAILTRGNESRVAEKIERIVRDDSLYASIAIRDRQGKLLYGYGLPQAVQQRFVHEDYCDSVYINSIFSQPDGGRHDNYLSLMRFVCRPADELRIILTMNLDAMMNGLMLHTRLGGQARLYDSNWQQVYPVPGETENENSGLLKRVHHGNGYYLDEQGNTLLVNKVYTSENRYFNLVYQVPAANIKQALGGYTFSGLRVILHLLVTLLLIMVMKHGCRQLKKLQQRLFGNLNVLNPMAVLDNDFYITYRNPAFAVVLERVKGQGNILESLLSLKGAAQRYQFYRSLYRGNIYKNEISFEVNGHVDDYKIDVSLSNRRNERYLISMMNISEYVTADRKIKSELYTDYLTSLYNRKKFDEEMKRLIPLAGKQGSTRSFLMLLDIDDFKHINDTRGHEAGDKVLAALAQEIVSSVREDDMSFRIGGDEFAIIVNNINISEGALHDVELIARRLLRAIDASPQIPTGVSIGISCIEYGVSQTFNRADKKLYLVKNREKNSFLL